MIGVPAVQVAIIGLQPPELYGCGSYTLKGNLGVRCIHMETEGNTFHLWNFQIYEPSFPRFFLELGSEIWKQIVLKKLCFKG